MNYFGLSSFAFRIFLVLPALFIFVILLFSFTFLPVTNFPNMFCRMFSHSLRSYLIFLLKDFCSALMASGFKAFLYIAIAKDLSSALYILVIALTEVICV